MDDLSEATPIPPHTVDAECPHCHETVPFTFTAGLPEKTTLTLSLGVEPGQYINAKTLGGVLSAFAGLQKAVGKEMGAATVTMIESLATDSDGTIHINFLIANTSGAAEKGV